ncbi:PREDICTED: AT-hook motif nuclear-localized protein 7-like [Camelina sativa]|uniref:AT-hook motif nuclear-localized protein n=1 Tax=Camelina sativa TaxID=90675 RepID=A0ABM0VHQ6_CAMSA|nr:PREDICTED: AT-hook motif nuclear-localized protein 7-like [Camelina sativa]XP_010456312.1 PREDICTED: AT-hook motif nuclear-localized protein 7-like [Camelina sativa]
METSDRISSGGGGVTVIGPEAPSPYHMAPRPSETETPPHNHFLGSSLSPLDPPLPSSSGKKRRGRPRKYEPNGTPSSSSTTPLVKKRAQRPKLNGAFHFNIHKTTSPFPSSSSSGQKFGLESGVGSNFTPHIITVNTGEDITMRIISFSQQGPRAICILSANGVVSNVTLRQPDSCGGTLTYEGRFEILSLSGSFMETENQGGSRGRSGGMSVSLAGPDGRVVGGGVAGLFIAATPIQVVVGSFITSDQQDHLKPRKQRVEHTPATVLSLPTPPPPASVFSSSNPDREQPPSTFGMSSWTNGPRNSATDINISLPAD